MKIINCECCKGAGAYISYNEYSYGTDCRDIECEECLGRGYFTVPDPNELMKKIVYENENRLGL